MHPLSVATKTIGEQLLDQIIQEVIAQQVPFKDLATPHNLPENITHEIRTLVKLEQQAALAYGKQISHALQNSNANLSRTRNAVDFVHCANCGTQISAPRFSRHLQGCMLGKGRAASRAAQQSMRELASYT